MVVTMPVHDYFKIKQIKVLTKWINRRQTIDMISKEKEYKDF